MNKLFAVGTDIIEISRIKKSMENPRFINEFFGEKEKEELKKRNFPSETAAGAFAGKEAFSKALGIGIVGFSLCEVQILHTANGKPYLHLSGRAKNIVGKKQFDISISHTDTLAAATVIAWEE